MEKTEDWIPDKPGYAVKRINAGAFTDLGSKVVTMETSSYIR